MKRSLDSLYSIHQSSTEATKKQARQPTSKADDVLVDQKEEPGDLKDDRDPLCYWMKHHRWPKKCFEAKSKNVGHVLAGQTSLGPLLLKQCVLASLDPVFVSRGSVAPTFMSPRDQNPREIKSEPYKDPRYELLLSAKGSFMDESELDVAQTSTKLYLKLLDTDQTVPKNTLFRDNVFKQTCSRIQGKNEERVIRDISPLIVPSAEILASRGAKHLDILIESTNEVWNNSIPLTGTRPQPDFSVGFRREAFTQEQLDKLAPYTGNFTSGNQSFFMATHYMCLPFLTCEVKCGDAGLDIADRQNAHSMTLAVRATVELFRLVGREMELDRELIAFSISHDDNSVRLYGHYPVIFGKDIEYYRFTIDEFNFVADDGVDRWAAYKFTKNVYNLWMPSHFKRLCSVIDEIPAVLDVNVSNFS